MAIKFECSDKKVTLFYGDSQLMETPRKSKLQVGGEDFTEKFSGTKVEDIPADISFYIDNLPRDFSPLSAVSLDNSKEGMSILLMLDYIDLHSWMKPFSFDEYISQLELLVEGKVAPIEKYSKVEESPVFVSHTVLGVKFFLESGDLMESILTHAKNISNAQNKANHVLSEHNLPDGLGPQKSYEFIEGNKCDLEEDLITEFKEVKGQNPAKSIQKLVDGYILAFLNNKGGSIFWGICDDGIVKSLKLTSKFKDDINKAVNSKINTIEPPLDPTQIGVFFHEVAHVENGYVLEVRVPKSNSNGLYFNSSGNTWVRLNGCNQKLQGVALQEYIVQRQKKTHN